MQLKDGAGVVTTRDHTHWVVTEFGAVNLHGKTLRQRAELLISIAHPEFRAELTKDFARLRHVTLDEEPPQLRRRHAVALLDAAPSTTGHIDVSVTLVAFKVARLWLVVFALSCAPEVRREAQCRELEPDPTGATIGRGEVNGPVQLAGFQVEVFLQTSVGTLCEPGWRVEGDVVDPQNQPVAAEILRWPTSGTAARLPANNGKVGTWGVSYPGFYAAQAAIDAHPALKAVSPQAPVTDWYLGDDFHHNGALFLMDTFNFFSGFGKARPAPTRKSTWGFDHDTGDAYEFFLNLGPLKNANEKYFKGEIAFWNEALAHPNRDEYWKARDPRPRYAKVKPSVLVVGGLFDAEDLWGTVATYRAFESQSPGSDVRLVLGPWRHGGWARTEGDALGEMSFGWKTSRHYQETIELPFFKKALKACGDEKAVEATVFETGTPITSGPYLVTVRFEPSLAQVQRVVQVGIDRSTEPRAPARRRVAVSTQPMPDTLSNAGRLSNL